MKTVVIRIYQGVVEVARLPKDTKVIVKDYDTACYDEDDPRIEVDKDREKHVEIVHENQ